MSRHERHRRRSRKTTVAAVAVLALLACAWLIPVGVATASTSGNTVVRVTVLDSLGIGGDAKEIYAEAQHGPQYEARFVTQAASLILGETGVADNEVGQAAGDSEQVPSSDGNSINGTSGVAWCGIQLIITATHL